MAFETPRLPTRLARRVKPPQPAKYKATTPVTTATGITPLHRLPIEILLQIVKHFRHTRGINALCRTSKLLNYLLSPHLYAVGGKRTYYDGTTALHRCARLNCGVRPLQALLAAGNNRFLDVMVTRYPFPFTRGATPLMVALESKNMEIFEYLLSVGASETMAISADWLLLSGLDQDAHLFLARHTGRVNTLRLLERLHVQRKLRSRWALDRYGFTMLHHAVQGGHGPVVGYILAGPDPPQAQQMRRLDDGMTLLECALVKGYVDVFSLLVNGFADKAGLHARSKEGETLLHLAAEKGSVAKVQQLLDAGININSRNRRGETALHVAAREGRVDVVRLLVQRNARNIWDSEGYFPLHRAVADKRWEVVEAMVKVGMDIDAKDRRGLTAGESAPRGVLGAHTKVVQLLLDGNGKGRKGAFLDKNRSKG